MRPTDEFGVIVAERLEAFEVEVTGRIDAQEIVVSGKLDQGDSAADVNANTTTIDGGKIRAGRIESTNYNGPDGAERFADAGTLLDLDSGDIISPHFVSEAAGAAFRGDSLELTDASNDLIFRADIDGIEIGQAGAGVLKPIKFTTDGDLSMGASYLEVLANTALFDITDGLTILSRDTLTMSGLEGVDITNNDGDVRVRAFGANRVRIDGAEDINMVTDGAIKRYDSAEPSGGGYVGNIPAVTYGQVQKTGHHFSSSSTFAYVGGCYLNAGSSPISGALLVTMTVDFACSSSPPALGIAQLGIQRNGSGGFVTDSGEPRAIWRCQNDEERGTVSQTYIVPFAADEQIELRVYAAEIFGDIVVRAGNTTITYLSLRTST